MLRKVSQNVNRLFQWCRICQRNGEFSLRKNSTEIRDNRSLLEFIHIYGKKNQHLPVKLLIVPNERKDFSDVFEKKNYLRLKRTRRKDRSISSILVLP